MKKTSLKKRLLWNGIYEASLYFFACLLIIPLAFILIYIIKQGITVINWEFLTSLPKPVGESGGGVSNAIIGSLQLIILATIIAIPVGVLMGTYLAENSTHRLAYWTSLCIDTLQGTPSIVIGIIAYTWIVVPLGSFSVFSGGVALSLIMLPLIIKSTEESIKLIPGSLKEASYALGAPYYKTVLKVVIPSAKNAIVSSVLLGIARISGETAPLLFTAFGNPFMNVNVFEASNALPLLIFNYATSPYADWQSLAWGSSFLLVSFVLFLSVLAKVVVKK